MHLRTSRGKRVESGKQNGSGGAGFDKRGLALMGLQTPANSTSSFTLLRSVISLHTTSICNTSAITGRKEGNMGLN